MRRIREFATDHFDPPYFLTVPPSVPADHLCFQSLG